MTSHSTSMEPWFTTLLDKKIRLRAPAKVNLALHITGRRPDGFHQLSMLNVPVSLADELWLTLVYRGTRRLNVTGPFAAELIEPTSNLVFRALATILPADIGFELNLVKNIPIGGGLGGGSSDAGAVLRLAKCFGVSKDELSTIALSLGTDIPFFLGVGPALVEGIGEILTPIEKISCPSNLTLIIPPLSVATPDAYRWYREGGFGFSPPLSSHDIEFGIFKNDLASAVLAHTPALRELSLELQELGVSPQMSGSGAVLFTFNQNPETQETLGKWGKKKGVQLCSVNILPRFELHVEEK